MPALNYTVFIDKVLSGEKRQTIRAQRKYPIKKGDRLYHYTGMRRKGCRKLGESTCTKTTTIDLRLINLFEDSTEVCLSVFHSKKNQCWPLEWQEALAKDDGFNNWEEMAAWFIKSHKFKPGDTKEFVIIKWGELDA